MAIKQTAPTSGQKKIQKLKKRTLQPITRSATSKATGATTTTKKGLTSISKSEFDSGSPTGKKVARKLTKKK